MATRGGRLAVILACSVLVCLPLFLHGPSCGHDFDFHLQSWFAARAAWQAGVAYPHWVPAANYGAGEPRFVFYPPLSWMLGAVLGTVLPWGVAPQVFTLLAVTGCGFSFYALARRWVRRGVAAGAACVYLANPYLLFVAYERTAYGELLGAVAIPLVVLYALRQHTATIRLSVVVALLWLANAPSAVMGCYLLVACALAAAVAWRRVMVLWRAALALMLGAGLAAVYVLPAWYEQRWVEITRAVGPGMRVEDSFLFGHTGEPYHDQVLHTASWIALAVLGVGLLAIAGWLVLEARAGNRPAAAPATQGLHRPLAGLAGFGLLAILCLLLPWSDLVWRSAPELRFLQFPWRWLLVGGVAAALGVALLAERLGAGRRLGPAGRGAIALTLCAVALGSGQLAQHNFAQVCDEEDNVAAQQRLPAPAQSGPSRAEGPAGFEGTDEYTPTGADNGEVQQGLPRVRLLPAPGDDEGDDSGSANPLWQPDVPSGADISASGQSQQPGARPSPAMSAVEEWAPEHKLITVNARVPGYAVLRLMDYPAWEVLVDRRAIPARPHREDGLLTVPVARGVSSIEVAYRATWDVRLARALSLVSLCVLAALCLLRRRHPGDLQHRRSVGREAPL